MKGRLARTTPYRWVVMDSDNLVLGYIQRVGAFFDGFDKDMERVGTDYSTLQAAKRALVRRIKEQAQ